MQESSLNLRLPDTHTECQVCKSCCFHPACLQASTASLLTSTIVASCRSPTLDFLPPLSPNRAWSAGSWRSHPDLKSRTSSGSMLNKCDWSQVSPNGILLPLLAFHSQLSQAHHVPVRCLIQFSVKSCKLTRTSLTVAATGQCKFGLELDVPEHHVGHLVLDVESCRSQKSTGSASRQWTLSRWRHTVGCGSGVEAEFHFCGNDVAIAFWKSRKQEL